MEGNKKLLHQEVAQKMMEEIKSGKYGQPGERFLTIKELICEKQVSTKTAQNIVYELRKNKLIKLVGKNYYLSYDLLNIGTPLHKQMKPNKIIGFHLTNFSNIISDPLIKHVTLLAKQHGYEIITACSFYDEQKEKDILDMFIKLNVSGIFSMPYVGEVSSSFYQNFYLPIVFFGHRPDHVDGDCVYFKNVKLGENIAEHFVTKGYRNFAYVGVDVWKKEPRLEGFKSKLLEEGFTVPEQNILFVKEREIYEIANKVRVLLMHQIEPIAIFCLNDYLALNLIHICNQFGYQIPKQVAIAGCGNSSSSNYSTPTITSVDFNVRKLAEIGFDFLMNQIKKGVKSNIGYEVETILYIRESTNKKETKT